MPRLPLATILAGLLLVAAACVPGEAQPSGCDAQDVTFQTTLANDKLDPADFSVCKDQHVTITVAVQEEGEFHLHGYETQVEETEVAVGDTFVADFVADTVGQFPIELHSLDGSTETQIGSLTVTEP